MSIATVLIIGSGVLGGSVLDQLALARPSYRYILASRDEERLRRRSNLTKYVCAKWGSYPRIEFKAVNVLSQDRLAALIRETCPSLVFNATTPFPWWRIDELPPDLSRLAHSAGPGIWCALDGILPRAIAEAILLSGQDPIYVNGCYPDLVNAFLSVHPNGPMVGIGNLSNVIPGLKLTYSDLLGVSPKHLSVRLVAHHFTSLNAPTEGECLGAPYYLRIDHPAGYEEFAGSEDRPFRQLRERYPRIRGLGGQAVTCSSAASLLAALLDDSERELHAPGPLGLPGGYPIIVRRDNSVEIDTGGHFEVSIAQEINEQAQRFDGIKRVEGDLIELTDSARDAFRLLLQFDPPIITTENVEHVARECVDRLNQLYDLRIRL